MKEVTDSELLSYQLLIISGIKIVLFLIRRSLDHIESKYPQVPIKAGKWITKTDLIQNRFHHHHGLAS